MSDHSSAPDSDGFGSLSASSPPPVGHLAFLVHSQDSVERNLPPDVDNKPLARQRRRRTSPEDQKILEAEYHKNPKPDKADRMAIVNRVALGEKEVQIWFQNRRQNSRRKSQAPLVTYELRDEDPSRDPDGYATGNPSDSNTNMEVDEEKRNVSVIDVPSSQPLDETIALEPLPRQHADTATSPAESNEDLEEAENVSNSQETVADLQRAIPASQTYTTDQGESQETLPTALTSSQPRSQNIPSSQDAAPPSSATGYLANRRSASFRAQDQVTVTDARTNPLTSSSPGSNDESSTRQLGRTSSFLRLAMTSDGGAKLINAAEQSPSPPRKLPSTAPLPSSRQPGLRRSFSAAGLHDKFLAAAGESPDGSRKLARTSSGRSRDSRAWEFWCDSDARNSLLSEKADQEASGDAADAIGLIRAASNSKSALRNNPAKQNTPVQARGKTSKPGLGEKKKPGMKRASTSQGRLQSKAMVGSKQGNPLREDSEEFERPNTESDKENWEPSESQAAPRNRAAAGRINRRVLGENTDVMTQTWGRAGLKMGKADKENEDVDGEVAAFMAGGKAGERASTSSEEDLNVVQGLLKLSQGNWK